MSQLEQLLVVQEHDTLIRQLNHRRASLPEREQAEEVRAEISGIVAETAPVTEDRARIAREQSLIEDEVTLVVAKQEREDAKLYSGEVTGVKELQALQDELASLKRRQNELEDRVIELMEEAEPVDAEIERLGTTKADAEARLLALEQAITVAEAEIDVELASEADKRDTSSAGIDADLLDDYRRIAADTGGVAIARFANGICEGCHLKLPAMEADRIKKADPGAVQYCDSCHRILVP